jgi:hypothetical protein
MSPLVMRYQIFSQHPLAAKVARPSNRLVVMQFGMLFQPGGRLEAAPTVFTLEELAHEAVCVGNMAIGVVLAFKGRRTVRAGEPTLPNMSASHMFTQEGGLHEGLGTNGARVLRPRS